MLNVKVKTLLHTWSEMFVLLASFVIFPGQLCVLLGLNFSFGSRWSFTGFLLLFGLLWESEDDLWNPLVFKEDEADGQDEGDESNCQKGDWGNLEPVTGLWDPLGVISIVPFYHPIVCGYCGFRTCNDEWSRGGVKKESENSHSQSDPFSRAAFWPEVEAH